MDIRTIVEEVTHIGVGIGFQVPLLVIMRSLFCGYIDTALPFIRTYGRIGSDFNVEMMEQISIRNKEVVHIVF